MTNSKEAMETEVTHKESVSSGFEHRHEHGLEESQHELEPFENRALDFRTVMAIIV